MAALTCEGVWARRKQVRDGPELNARTDRRTPPHGQMAPSGGTVGPNRVSYPTNS